MATVIQGYLKEIEELRAKLCESENLCQQLRKQINNRANNPARLSMSPMHVPMSGEAVRCEGKWWWIISKEILLYTKFNKIFVITVNFVQFRVKRPLT